MQETKRSAHSTAESEFNVVITVVRQPCSHCTWNTRVLDDDVRHVCDTCFDKGKTESCLVKAPAMRASESVLVVSELLCTGVQANTERHTKERNARNVLMLGIQTTLLLTQFERVA